MGGEDLLSERFNAVSAVGVDAQVELIKDKELLVSQQESERS